MSLKINLTVNLSFGTRFYILANMAGKRSALIQTAHPYLQAINEKTKLSAFLGLRSDLSGHSHR